MPLPDTTCADSLTLQKKADKLFYQGNFNSALECYQELISRCEDKQTAYPYYIRRAEALRLSKHLKLAYLETDSILLAYNRPATALRIRGRILFDDKRYEEATRIFMLVLKEIPNDEESLFHKELAEELVRWGRSKPLTVSTERSLNARLLLDSSHNKLGASAQKIEYGEYLRRKPLLKGDASSGFNAGLGAGKYSKYSLEV